MTRNSKYNLVPYEVIERAITGDTAALLAVQERHRAYMGRLSGGNANMKERLNAKLLIAVMKFRLEYQPLRKQQSQKQPSRINFALRVLDGCFRLCCWVIKRAQTDRPLAPSPNYGVRCHAIGVEKTCIHAAL